MRAPSLLERRLRDVTMPTVGELIFRDDQEQCGPNKT